MWRKVDHPVSCRQPRHPYLRRKTRSILLDLRVCFRGGVRLGNTSFEKSIKSPKVISSGRPSTRCERASGVGRWQGGRSIIFKARAITSPKLSLPARAAPLICPRSETRGDPLPATSRRWIPWAHNPQTRFGSVSRRGVGGPTSCSTGRLET